MWIIKLENMYSWVLLWDFDCIRNSNLKVNLDAGLYLKSVEFTYRLIGVLCLTIRGFCSGDFSIPTEFQLLADLPLISFSYSIHVNCLLVYFYFSVWCVFVILFYAVGSTGLLFLSLFTLWSNFSLQKKKKTVVFFRY